MLPRLTALPADCFFAAFKTSCTDGELPITADKFYSHHMQPARPAGHSQLDAKRTSYKQIGKYIKQMHKSKVINVRDVKNTITILSVDRRRAHTPSTPPPALHARLGELTGLLDSSCMLCSPKT